MSLQGEEGERSLRIKPRMEDIKLLSVIFAPLIGRMRLFFGSPQTGNEMRGDAHHPDDDQVNGDDVIQQLRLNENKNSAKQRDDCLKRD